jgi:hypothetical protein
LEGLYGNAEAESVVGPEKLVRYSLLAGEQTLAAYAYQDNSLLSERILLEYQLGDFHQGEAFLVRHLEGVRPDLQNAYPVLTIPWVARVTGESGWLDVAVALAQSILSSHSSNPLAVLCSRAGLGMVAVLRGNTAAATDQYEALEAQRASGCLPD